MTPQAILISFVSAITIIVVWVAAIVFAKLLTERKLK